MAYDFDGRVTATNKNNTKKRKQQMGNTISREYPFMIMTDNEKQELFNFCHMGYYPDDGYKPKFLQIALTSQPPLVEKSKDDLTAWIPTDELKRIASQMKDHPYHPRQEPPPYGFNDHVW